MEQVPQPYQSPFGDETKVRLEVLNPARDQKVSPYARDINRSLRLGNIKREDWEWYSEMQSKSKELIDLYTFMGLEEQAEIIRHELQARWEATASRDGWQAEHLGSATGSSRSVTTIKQEQPPTGGKA